MEALTLFNVNSRPSQTMDPATAGNAKPTLISANQRYFFIEMLQNHVMFHLRFSGMLETASRHWESRNVRFQIASVALEIFETMNTESLQYLLSIESRDLIN
jgi:hypothetical protein